jgi:hypothetical protein
MLQHGPLGRETCNPSCHNAQKCETIDFFLNLYFMYSCLIFGDNCCLS